MVVGTDRGVTVLYGEGAMVLAISAVSPFIGAAANIPDQSLIIETAGKQYMIVNGRDERGLALLEQAHKNILLPSFRIAHDIEPYELWRDRITTPETNLDLIAVIGGENLETSKPDLKAVAIAEIYSGQQEDAAQCTWNIVAPSARGQGWGRGMVQTRLQAIENTSALRDRTPGCVFIEVNDPRLTTTQYSDAPESVRDTFRRFGARELLGVNYVRPDALGSKELTEDFSLMFYPVDGRLPDRGNIQNALTGLYRHAYGIDDAESHPALQQMLAELDAWDGFEPDANNFTPRH